MKNQIMNTKTILFASLIAAMILPFSGMDFVDAEATKITHNVTKDEFLQAVDRVQNIREQQSKIHDIPKESLKADDLSRLSQLESEIVTDLAILEKYEEQRKALYVIEPERKIYLETVELDVREQVAELADKVGLNAYAVNLDKKTREIVISVNDLSFNKKIEEIIATQPKDVQYKIELRTFGDESCTSKTSDCDPIVGGIQVIDTSPGSPCAMGLPVRTGSWPFYTYGFITAGHCAEDNDSLYQPGTVSTTYKIGDSTDSRYDSMCDCAFVSKTTWTTSQSKIWSASNTYVTMTSEQTSRPSDGDQVKLYGLISGIKSGEVVDYNYSYYYNGVNWTLVDTDITTNPGDSGSPYTNSAANKIVGIHKAGNGIFTPWNEIDGRFSVSLS